MIERIKNKWGTIQNYIKDNFDVTDTSFDVWILPLKPLKISKSAGDNLVLISWVMKMNFTETMCRQDMVCF